MYTILNGIPGFASLKIETVSKVIMDVRRMFQMFEFESKPTLFKANSKNTRTKCKIYSKLNIKKPE